MRISRRGKKKEEPKKNYHYNEGIAAPKILVLDSAGASLGIMTTAEAIRVAREQELDLVEINPKTDPPVAKIMDFGQFRYAQEKEMRLRRAHQHTVEIKGVRLSLRIGKNDLLIRQNQAIKFLDNGDKVKIEVALRGREMQQGALAFDMIKKFMQDITAECKIRVEQEIEKQGNKVTSIIAKS